MRNAFLCSILLAIATPAYGQSFNIDFGSSGSTPAATYAAAGIPGTWNAIGVLPPFERAPLVDLAGQPSSAMIYMFGGTIMMEVDDPGTSDDHQALMDDMLIGYCDPVDVCIWVENLVVGDYEVLTYALTPSDPARTCPVRVDFGSPGPTNVGGAWPGDHAELVTYVRHTVTPTNNKIALHSGTYNGNFQAGINGIQIRQLSGVSVDPSPSQGETRIRRISPNPSASPQTIEFTLAGTNAGRDLEIIDLAGRQVCRRPLAGLSAGAQALQWDGLDTAGRRARAGIYLARIAGADPGAVASLHKLVRIQ